MNRLEMNRLPEEEKKKLSLRYSLIDGGFFSAMVGLGENFFQAFAVFLKASGPQLGLLGSLPQTLSSVAQVFSPAILHRIRFRQRMVCIGVLVQALSFIPIALVFYTGSLRVYHLILFVCLYYTAGSVAGPAWNSWMGDLLEENTRGTYFGRRNRILGLVSFLTYIPAGFLLQRFAGRQAAYAGFVFLFGLALASRLVSLYFLTRKYEPPFETPVADRLVRNNFSLGHGSPNYRRFVIFSSLFTLTLFISAPFNTAFLLNGRHCDYWQLTLVLGISVVARFIFIPLWGKISDRYGSRKVLTLTSLAMPLGVLVWPLYPALWYLMLVQVYMGFVWAGFDIAVTSFLYDCTCPEERTRCVSFYNVCSGLAIFLGAMLGGFLVKHNTFLGNPYALLFFLSASLRWVVAIIFLPGIKEERCVEHISYNQMLVKVFTSAAMEGGLYDWVPFKRRERKV